MDDKLTPAMDVISCIKYVGQFADFYTYPLWGKLKTFNIELTNLFNLKRQV